MPPSQGEKSGAQSRKDRRQAGFSFVCFYSEIPSPHSMTLNRVSLTSTRIVMYIYGTSSLPLYTKSFVGQNDYLSERTLRVVYNVHGYLTLNSACRDTVCDNDNNHEYSEHFIWEWAESAVGLEKKKPACR